MHITSLQSNCWVTSFTQYNVNADFLATIVKTHGRDTMSCKAKKQQHILSLQGSPSIT